LRLWRINNARQRVCKKDERRHKVLAESDGNPQIFSPAARESEKRIFAWLGEIPLDGALDFVSAEDDFGVRGNLADFFVPLVGVFHRGGRCCVEHDDCAICAFVVLRPETVQVVPVAAADVPDLEANVASGCAKHDRSDVDAYGREADLREAAADVAQHERRLPTAAVPN
jgi:hypothetical protein